MTITPRMLAMLVLVPLVGALLLVPACSSSQQTAPKQREGVSWIWNDLGKGKRLAREQDKKILLYFWAVW